MRSLRLQQELRRLLGGEGVHVVVVDPSRVVRRPVGEMLEAGGHSVTAFDNSRSALAHVEADTSVTCVWIGVEP